MPLRNPPSVPPVLVVPIVNGAITNGVWSAAQRACFIRFQQATTGVYRYINWTCAIASGNVQVGVVAMSGTGRISYGAPLVTTGVIACPTAADIRSDVGAFTLTPGDYALFLWADNTTVSVGRSTGVPSSQRMAGFVNSLATGVIAGGTLTLSTIAPSLVLEADV